jgi:hypothetical protein
LSELRLHEIFGTWDEARASRRKVCIILPFVFFCTSCEIKRTDDNGKQFIENTFHSLGSGVAIFSTFLQNELVIECMSV